jgi:hypothetical protein
VSGRRDEMNKRFVAFISAFGGVAAALVTTQAFGTEPWVTYLALGGLAISQLLTHSSVDQVNKDLHNGTFEKLLKEALKALAKEEGVPLEVRQPEEHREEDTP